MLNCDRIDKKSPGYSLNRAEGMHPTNSDQRVEYSNRKIISLKPPRNPDLERLRVSVLSQKDNYTERTFLLKDQVRHIHAAYLFSTTGKTILASLCKVISSTPSSPFISSWKDLGNALGLCNLKLGCIEHTCKGDPTETVLKWYSQSWDSTLDQVVAALQQINRYDAIVEAESGLQELAKLARQEQIRRTEDLSIEKGTSDGILRPELYHPYLFSSQLPITLKVIPEKGVSAIIKDLGRIERCDERLQNASVIKKKQKKFSKAVMLTFADDGEELARAVATELRRPRGRHLPIGVLLLEEQFDKVLENTEDFIVHIFPQMHYIIPIVTSGYLRALEDGESNSCNGSIDSQYVKLIHDLMMKEYVRNNCRNKRFRCLIPDDHFQFVLSHKHMNLDPVLKVYEKESHLEKLASRMLQTRLTDNTPSGYNRAV